MYTIELTEKKVLETVVNELQNGLPIEWQGRLYGPTEVWQTLVGASAQTLSVSQQTGTAQGGPHGNTVMVILRQQSWWDRAKLERFGNRLLQSSAGNLGPGPVTLAIDLHHQPYYGKKEGIVCGGEKKQGTNKFFSFATAYVIRAHREVTLAITVVEPGDTLVEIVARLLAALDPLDLWVDRILMDREFFAAEVMELLQGCDCPFTIPVKRTGDAKRGNGTQRLFQWELSAWTPWKLRSRQAHVHFDVAIVVRHEKKGRVTLPYAADGIEKVAPEQAKKRYGKRFGIESSYRQANQALIPTSSKDPVYRLLRLILALVLRNVWLRIRRQLGEKRTGRRGVWLPRKFTPFRQFLGWLMVAIRTIWPLRPPETVLAQRQRTPQRCRRLDRLQRRRVA